MLALIDGDVIVYQAGFASDTREYSVRKHKFKYKKEANAFCKENDIPLDEIELKIIPEPVEHCLHSVKEMINNILKNSSSDEYLVCLSGEDNFRDDLYSEYKANRDPSHKPTHYKAIKEYLLEYHPCHVSVNEEADDAMGKVQYTDWFDVHYGHSHVLNTTICTIDKDLNMIPGWHYNWNKEILYFVKEDEANKFFFQQWLTGDAADNIPGIKGVGDKTAQKMLKDCKSTLDMFEVCQEQHAKAGMSDDYAQMTADLLWIKRDDIHSWRDL